MTDPVVDSAVLATKDKDADWSSNEETTHTTKPTTPTKPTEPKMDENINSSKTTEKQRTPNQCRKYTRNKNRKRRQRRKKQRKIAIQSMLETKQIAIIPKNQTEIIELASDTSPDSASDCDPSQNKKSLAKEKRVKRSSNDVHNHTQEISDNEIIFGVKGNENKREIAEKPATESKPMLSGNVSLSNFPLGSSHDCENLAHQLISILLQKKYENDISGHDICVFLKTLLRSNIIDEIDMIDTQEIQSQIGYILKRKQKHFRRGKQKPNYKLPRLGKKFNQGKAGGSLGDSDYDFRDLF